jgi:hypothetical protein
MSRARRQRRLRKSSGKVLEEDGIALTRAGFARTRETKIFREAF